MVRSKRPPTVNPKNLEQSLPSLYRKVGALKVDEEHPRTSFKRMVKILRAWAAEEFPDSDFYGEIVVRAENCSRSRHVQKLLREKRRESFLIRDRDRRDALLEDGILDETHWSEQQATPQHTEAVPAGLLMPDALQPEISEDQNSY
ncbi:hypothetical protein NDN08_004921 [Rhodosorus marinus]|uniref:Uncharacterized protein n=1 Tax=Rhodosorus marinus TaxID=101924 RepID=A0AAV8UK88_9RHOD|nr:hypothetical protein NDN08_004921 [Rhodosorus marinus]